MIKIKVIMIIEVLWKFCILAGITHLFLGHLFFETIIPNQFAVFCEKLNYVYAEWHLLILSSIVAILWQIIYEWRLYIKRKNQTKNINSYQVL